MTDTPTNPHSRGPAVLIVTVIMMVLATIFVVLRMISRFGIVKRITLDDYFMMLAWVREVKIQETRTMG
jgi:hypothetical protein